MFAASASPSSETDLYIDTPEALHAWLPSLDGAPFLAIDTEFVREDTYYAKLCLIQIGDGRRCALIDTRVLSDLSPLLRRLHDSSTLKVFHAAQQDLEIFVQLDGRCPAPIFDTQIAASLLGYGDQLGYAGLIERMLGIKLDKSLSRTDWTRRPLSAAELSYAADDVRHLARIYPQLEAALLAQERLDWLREDCVRQANPERYRAQPALEWQRLKGLARLDVAGQHVAAALAQWRETVAENRNRPRKWILADDALYRIAERRPQARAQLEELQVLPPKTLERHAEALLGIVGAVAKGGLAPLVRDERPEESEKKRLRSLLDRLKAIAIRLNLPPSQIANRSDIERLAFEGEASGIALMSGWRRRVAGEELLAIAVGLSKPST